jgi:hypothetical protein
MAALAGRLRDNADQLWLISQGWAPPGGHDGAALDTLLTETVAVAEEMARRVQALSDETRNVSPPPSPDQAG